MKSYTNIILSGTVFFGLALTSCGDDTTPVETAPKKKINKEFNDPNRSFNTSFDGKLFSIPSPIQTALLIKEVNLTYNEDLLNGTDKIGDYGSEVKKAVNLGIYGADLGYTTLYSQNSKALNYLNAIESLSNDLGISGAFDKNFLERFEANSTNQDSMLVILTDAFRKGDNFLKQNERKNVSALILAGGWIESMHFATKLYESSKNDVVLARIGEQKQTLKTLIEILGKYNSDAVNDSILTQLNDLKTAFDKVEINYTFQAPTTDEAKKVTTFNNTTVVNISDEVLQEIITKTAALRAAVSA